MLGCVNFAVHPQDLLCGRDLVRINKAVPMVSKSHPELRARRSGQHHTACSAMKIDDEIGGSCRRRTDFIYIGAAFENGSEPRLDHNGNLQIRPVTLE